MNWTLTAVIALAVSVLVLFLLGRSKALSPIVTACTVLGATAAWSSSYLLGLMI